ncbi:hypothetical protein LCGC14_1550460 [marine sediment metagenome]|uniref:Uncharacterized protein n=1 Tax=marine sediment metagenome TaxID=412755 RepID=A0A0F9L6E0_9ZZZZ
MGETKEPQTEQAELGFTTVNLPSRGVLYDDKIPDGQVGVRKIMGSEEALLLAQGSQGLERMEITLKKCVRLPNDFKHSDLLMTDRMACMLAMRTITFGPRYQFDYKCRYCGQQQQAEISILEDLDEATPDSLALKMAEKGIEDWTLEEPVHLDLPDAKKHITLRFLRGYDEQKIVRRTKRLLLQSVDPGDPSYLFRFALQIVSIDEEELDSKAGLSKRELFVRKLTATDTAAIRIAVDEVEPGIDLTVYPECRGCGAANSMPMPFTAEFFRPTRL